MRNEVHYSNACNIVCWKAFVSHLYTYIEFFCFQTYALLSWCVWFLILLTVQWWHLVTKSWAYELWNTLHVGILSELFPDWDRSFLAKQCCGTMTCCISKNDFLHGHCTCLSLTCRNCFLEVIAAERDWTSKEMHKFTALFDNTSHAANIFK